MKQAVTFITALFLFFTSIHAQSPANTLYVVNNLGETLSKVNLETGVVTNDIITLGNAPNDMRTAGTSAYITNSTSADVSVIGLESQSLIKLISLEDQGNPWSMSIDGSDRAFVTNSGLNTVSVLDLSSDEITNTIQVGLWPEGMLDTGNNLYVVNTGFDINTYGYSGCSVFVIDKQTLTVTDSIYVPVNPQALVEGTDGNIYVLCTGDYFSEFGKIAVIDPASKTVLDTIITGGTPGDLTVTPSGKLFIAGAGGWSAGEDGNVFLHDIPTGSILNDSSNPIITEASASRIIADGDNAVYVSCFADDIVQKLDPVTGDTLASYEVGDGPQALALYTGTVSAIDDDRIPSVRNFILEQNYPNPFNPVTTIMYNLPSPGMVRISVYSVTGQLIAELENSMQTAGAHSVDFDGSHLGSGVYFYTIRTASGTKTRKMLLVK